jgi:hypothetical protein
MHDHSLPMLTKSARSESCRYHLAPCDNQLVGTESRPERGCMFVATSRAYWALVYRNAASAQSSSRASCSHLIEPPTFRRSHSCELYASFPISQVKIVYVSMANMDNRNIICINSLPSRCIVEVQCCCRLRPQQSPCYMIRVGELV